LICFAIENIQVHGSLLLPPLVMGPLKFICYTEDVSNVFCRHAVKFHLFADDKQAYVSGHVSDANAIRQQLSDCATHIAGWSVVVCCIGSNNFYPPK